MRAFLCKKRLLPHAQFYTILCIMKSFVCHAILCYVAAAMSCSAVLPAHDTKTTQDINKMQMSLAKDLSAKSICKNHEGADKFQQKVEKSQYSNFWSSWSFSSSTKDAPLYLKVSYLDSAKMYAVHQDRSLVSKLSSQEWQALQEAERRLQTQITDDMSAYDKVLTIHDALVEQVEYDINKFTATDMLLKDKGRCDSYSRVMHLMLQMADVPAMRVIGMGKNEAHAWNLVKLDDKWYHIDATWNDPKGKKGESILRHHYFLLTDEEMKKDHKWEEGVYPVSAQGKAYYFRKNKTYFESYSPFWRAVSKAAGEGDDTFEAYLTCYKNEKTFEKELQEYAGKHPELNIRSWSGPEDKEGAVYLVFRKGSQKGKAKKRDYEYPVEDAESAKDWLGPDMLKRLYEKLGDPSALKKKVSESVKKVVPTRGGSTFPSYFF